jgi:hypothetical protein
METDVAVFIITSLLLGLIPAAIARSKGRDFLTWWIYGWMIFIVALVHAIVIRPSDDFADRPVEPEWKQKARQDTREQELWDKLVERLQNTR